MKKIYVSGINPEFPMEEWTDPSHTITSARAKVVFAASANSCFTKPVYVDVAITPEDSKIALNKDGRIGNSEKRDAFLSRFYGKIVSAACDQLRAAGQNVKAIKKQGVVKQIHIISLDTTYPKGVNGVNTILSNSLFTIGRHGDASELSIIQYHKDRDGLPAQTPHYSKHHIMNSFQKIRI